MIAKCKIISATSEIYERAGKTMKYIVRYSTFQHVIPIESYYTNEINYCKVVKSPYH